MNPVANAALTSWTIHPPALFVLFAVAILYLLGWLRGRKLLHTPEDHQRLAAFFSGLLLIFAATESPLDAFDNLYLSAHMAQHLLLMMIAPPLILLGHPLLPLLRGLPKRFVKEGLGPFLSWPSLRTIGSALVSPPVAWGSFAFSTIFWHLPRFYELALGSSFWHGVQHACFFWTGILFWWPIIQPTPAKPKWPLWTKIPYLLFADLVNTALSAFFVFSGHLLYPTYALARASNLSAQDDQTVAGLIMWVPGSVVYLIPAFVLAMRLFSSGRRAEQAAPVRIRRAPSPGKRTIWKRMPVWRRAFQAGMLLIAVLVVADGWFGPQVAPLNMAGILPWIDWRALSVLALLVAGNLFCMGCPFMLVRDGGRKLVSPKWRWPRALRNKWTAAMLLAIYLWAYEAFGLWDKPFLTASLIAGYFLAALLVDTLFRGASFCKYVCPIGQFHFVSSLVSPREVAVRSAATCQSCRTHDCIRGNQQSRGCELYLFQPKKSSNLDCTFCLDCVKACPHDNIGILPVIPAQTIIENPYRSSIGRLSKRTDLAALVLVFVFGAFANAAGMIAPVMAFEHKWHARLGLHSMPWIVGVLALLSLVVLPLFVTFLCGAVNAINREAIQRVPDFARRLVFALVPLGFAMWGAHLLYHFATGWNAVWPVLQQRFLSAGGQIAAPVVPDWLTGVQILLLDAGLVWTLYVAWRVTVQTVGKTCRALTVAFPWAAVAIGLYSAGVWILFQPMQMRGMMM